MKTNFDNKNFAQSLPFITAVGLRKNYGLLTYVMSVIEEVVDGQFTSLWKGEIWHSSMQA